MIPPGATHAHGQTYYRKRPQGGADVWCREKLGWKYMEDRSAKAAIRIAEKLESRK
ncbi:hypothetical protein KRX52_04195 [Pseudomonas sp. MAP12]|uniref:Uncharacterized protein n=1 Tax=Geopseudomonas aromaticivorans TaxID=2849492 RepID=A0ABS6MT57_9GAMM|nr:hypothetical protein [Pseudomonas aromaticivorans]MBV2131998.1 hypothetical protein [Pseudomonas aromaticivorans]